MADGVAITAGSGTTIATDDLGATGHVQWTKLRDGTDGGTDTIPGTAARGLSVDPRLKVVRLQVTPTVSTSPAYSVKDAVGGLMTFSNAARTSGGSCEVQSCVVIDKSDTFVSGSMDLVLFDRTITAPTDNAIFAPTDAELANCVGFLPIGGWAALSVNSVACINNVGLEVLLNGTDLFGVLVARTTFTLTSTADLVVILTIVQD